MDEENNNELLKFQLKELKENIPALFEYQIIKAQIMRNMYENLLKEGFEKEQAIELVKGMEIGK